MNPILNGGQQRYRYVKIVCSRKIRIETLHLMRRDKCIQELREKGLIIEEGMPTAVLCEETRKIVKKYRLHVNEVCGMYTITYVKF